MNFRYLLLIISLLFISACREDDSAAIAPTLVESTVAQEVLVSSNLKLNGVVKNSVECPLAFQVGGIVAGRHIEPGDTIEPGQILLSLDDQDLIENVKASSAQYEDAKAKLKLATSDVKRYRKLHRAKAVSQAQYEAQETAYESALATFKQVSACYEQSKNMLDYSRLISQTNGVVTEVKVEEGQVVAPGQPVVVVAEAGKLEVEVHVSEDEHHNLSLGQQAPVRFWAFPGVKVEGSVREINPEADPISRTFKIKVALLAAPPEIKSGMSATVEIMSATQPESQIVIPATALFYESGLARVWLIKNETAVKTEVTVARFNNRQAWIKEGLRPGDEVVSGGLKKIISNSPIKRRKAAGSIKPPADQ